MNRILAVRIVRWYYKLLFAAGVWLAGYPVIALGDALGAPALVSDIGNSLVTLAGILLGARWFRGRDEPIEPPRPWWKMTARRTLSRNLGILAILGSLSIFSRSIYAALGVEWAVLQLERSSIAGDIQGGVFFAIVAFLYLNSAARLPKPTPRPVRDKFKSRMRLD